MCIYSKAERKGWRLLARWRLPSLPSTQGRRPLTLFHWVGLAAVRCGGLGSSSLRAATPAPPKVPVFQGWGGRVAQVPGLRDFGGSDRGIRGGQSPVWASSGGAAAQDAGRDHRERRKMRDGCRRGGQWRRGKMGWCHGNSQWRHGAGTASGCGASGLR